MSLTTLDVEKGLDEITRDKKKRTVALNQFNRDTNSGMNSHKAARLALQKAASTMPNANERYTAAVKAAGATKMAGARAIALTPRRQKSTNQLGNILTWVVLGLVGSAVGILFAMYTTAPWILNKWHGSWEGLAFPAALLYVVVVIAAGLTGGLWLAETISHRRSVTSSETITETIETIEPEGTEVFSGSQRP